MPTMAHATYARSDDRSDGGRAAHDERLTGDDHPRDDRPDGDGPATGGPATGGRPIDGIARLHLALPAHLDLTRIDDVLGSSDAPWLGERIPGESGPTREYACDLELPAGDMGPILFRKSAIVGLGEPARAGEGWRVPIDWHAATFKPLFPVFAGTLTILEGQVVLHGHYAPPGGRLGAVIDGTLLNVAARGTGRWFLRTVVAALDH